MAFRDNLDRDIYQTKEIREESSSWSSGVGKPYPDDPPPGQRPEDEVESDDWEAGKKPQPDPKN